MRKLNINKSITTDPLSILSDQMRFIKTCILDALTT